MINNKQKILARQWAENTRNLENNSPELNAVVNQILDTTNPLTMADMEWDNEKHRGVGATDAYGNMRVMLQDSGDYIGCIDSDFKLVGVERDKLTSNGKRYKLHEVADVPKLLEPSTKSMDGYKPCDHADMIGMWASYDSPDVNWEQHGTVIIAGEPDRAGRVPCYKPGVRVPEAWTFNLRELVPRFDLPRAWDVDGEPSNRERL